MRGYFGIGIINPKNELNIGTLWRSAKLMDAAFIFTIGRRYKRQPSDVLQTPRHVPLFEYQTWEDSVNTEIWFSDFFWPFFSNHTYDEIAKAVLTVLIKDGYSSSLDIEIPPDLIESFGIRCHDYNLLDERGCFNDPYRLVDLFCGKL